MCDGCAAALGKVKKFFLEKVVRIKKPAAKIVGVEIKDVSRDGVTLNAKISVNNPYAKALPISEISYDVKSAERMILSGKIEKVGSLPGNEETVVEAPVRVELTILLSLANDIAADWDIDYDLDLGLTIDLPLFGDFTIPLSWKGQIQLPTIPFVL